MQTQDHAARSFCQSEGNLRRTQCAGRPERLNWRLSELSVILQHSVHCLHAAELQLGCGWEEMPVKTRNVPALRFNGCDEQHAARADVRTHGRCFLISNRAKREARRRFKNCRAHPKTCKRARAAAKYLRVLTRRTAQTTAAREQCRAESLPQWPGRKASARMWERRTGNRRTTNAKGCGTGG